MMISTEHLADDRIAIPARWLAAAQILTAHPDGTQSFMPAIATCGNALQYNGMTWSNCVPIPIDLGSSSDQTVLELFGTGIRGANFQSSQGNVLAYAGSPCNESYCSTNYLTVLYAGPQNAFAGVDQVNVVLPKTRAGMMALTVQTFCGYANGNQPMACDSNTIYLDIK